MSEETKVNVIRRPNQKAANPDAAPKQDKSPQNPEKKVVIVKKKNILVKVKAPDEVKAPESVSIEKPNTGERQSVSWPPVKEGDKPIELTSKVPLADINPKKKAVKKEPEKPEIKDDKVISGMSFMDASKKPSLPSTRIQSSLGIGPVIIKKGDLPPISKDTKQVKHRVVGIVGGVGKQKDSASSAGQNARTPRAGDSYIPGFNNKPGSKPYTPFGARSIPGSAPRPGDGKQGGKKSAASSKRKAYENYRKDNEQEFRIMTKKSGVDKSAVPKSIDIMENISVADLAKKMNLKASDIISKLFSMGLMVTINQMIDHETAEIIASEYGCEIHLVSLYDETIIETEEDREEDMEPRAPIVTVMGHVDHGKTKLLDAIRKSNITEGEFGGITQHIGAYKVTVPEKGDIVFLDTPGHAAFSMMRARGAQVTDIVVLVVAANDGVMPQTREAIDHAKAAGVPIIVAINKMDLPDANPDRVMQQLSEVGLIPEEWGGQTLYAKISALKNEGIDELMDMILLQAEMLELKANRKCRAAGKILESRIDQGRGTVATVIIEKGILNLGDYYVAGIYPGRVRAMFDDKGKRIKSAGPSDPVEIIGLSDVPSAGDPFQVTEDEKTARMVGAKRQELERLGENATSKVTLENLNEKIKEGKIRDFNVLIKGDVQGSVEALKGVLEKLSNDEIRLSVLRASPGAIIESDISLASASDALVIGFNVRPTPRAQQLAEKENVEIRKYNVIYDVVDDIKAAMEGMLTPDIKEIDVGSIEVRATFKIPKVGIIAGCYVLEGKVNRHSLIRVIRDSVQINQGLLKIDSLKRFKDDAKEVAAGYECGIGLNNWQDIREGDILEVVETEEVKRSLELD